MDQQQPSSTEPKAAKCGGCWTGIYWWASLVVAVLAIPSVGFVMVKILPGHGITELAIFVLTCWVCTYLGMRLMKK